ncbi:MAG: hypothetical protein K8R41_12160, partial [Bacteroidales bacterium]|nr:hypothetical protein [Bacteroidales bacterium]
MKALNILFLIIVFQIGNVFSQNPNVSVNLDTNAVLIGDQVDLNIKFSLPAQFNVLWPDIKDTITANIEVVNRIPIDTVYSDNNENIILSQKLTLTSFDTGNYILPQMAFRYQSSDDTTQNVILSEALMLQVNTINVDTTMAIKPIKGPLKVPYTFKEIYPWVLGGIGVIAAIIFFIYYLRKRKKNEPVFKLKSKPKIPAHIIALDELDKLRRKKLWQTGNVKGFYTDLTDIVRTYIEGRFGIDAMEMTTFEIEASLRNANQIPKENKEKLYSTLVLADLVKFAKEKPLPDKNESSMNISENFIRKTIPVVREEGEGNEN